MKPPTVVLLAMAGTLLFVAATHVPLLQRRVKRNSFYGLRIKETLADDEVWYEANVAGAKWFILSVPPLLALLGLIYALPLKEEPKTLAMTLGMVAGILVPTVGGVIQAKAISARIMKKRGSR